MNDDVLKRHIHTGALPIVYLTAYVQPFLTHEIAGGMQIFPFSVAIAVSQLYLKLFMDTLMNIQTKKGKVF